MCGVIGALVVNPRTIKSHIIQVYQEQKTRGQKGFGVGIRKPDGTLLRDRTEEYNEILKSNIWDKIDVGDFIVYHHRTPTSTFNTPECNHPLMNEDKTLMVIHNGCTMSDMKLKKNHTFESEIETVVYSKNRIISQYTEWTDTEEAVHYYEENKSKNRLDELLNKIGKTGRSTYLYLDKNEDYLLFVARTNTLWAYKLGENTILSSEKGALKDKTLAMDLEPGYGWLTSDGVVHKTKGEWLSSYTSTSGYNNYYGVPTGNVGSNWHKNEHGGYTYRKPSQWDTMGEGIADRSNDETTPDDLLTQMVPDVPSITPVLDQQDSKKKRKKKARACGRLYHQEQKKASAKQSIRVACPHYDALTDGCDNCKIFGCRANPIHEYRLEGGCNVYTPSPP